MIAPIFHKNQHRKISISLTFTLPSFITIQCNSVLLMIGPWKMVKNPVCGHETHFFWLNLLKFTKPRLFLSFTIPISACSSFYVIGEKRSQKNTKSKWIFFVNLLKNVDVNSALDHKNFWQNVKPLYSNKAKAKPTIK